MENMSTKKPFSQKEKAVPCWQTMAEGRTLSDKALFRFALHKRPEVARTILEPILGRKGFEITNLEVSKHFTVRGCNTVVFDAVIEFADQDVARLKKQS